MNFKENLLIYLPVLALCVFISCEDNKKPSREELIDKELSQKIYAYRNKKYQECQKQFLTELEYEVDSMMYYLVEKMKGNSDQIPSRPIRPNRLVDTIELYTLDSVKVISN